MSQPSILLIAADQHHSRTLGTNDRKVRTPNIDRLAREGVQLDRAYAAVCPGRDPA